MQFIFWGLKKTRVRNFFSCNICTYCHPSVGWDPVLKKYYYKYLGPSLRWDDKKGSWDDKERSSYNKINKLNLTQISLSTVCVFSLLFSTTAHCYKLGIEAIPEQLKQQYANTPTRIGLITNHTGTDQQGIRTVDILVRQGFNITKLFVPEHGLHGTVPAEFAVADTRDKQTGLPVISLYGHGGPKLIMQDLFNDIDLLMFDMQDVGMRHYTYISTLYKVLEAAAQYKKKVIIFDRPNPLGDCMEGPLCATHLHSFIGICSIPLRHGMTIGELARLFNSKMLQVSADIEIVPLQNFARTTLMNRLVTHLSPNIATLHAAYGYSFLGLLGEVAPFDAGVGTSQAFQIITLPADLALSQAAWNSLQEQLKQFGISSQHYSYMHSGKRKEFYGLQLQIEHIDKVPAFKAFLAVLQWAKELKLPIKFARVFDKSVGTDKIRAWFDGCITREELLARIDDELQQFLQQHKDVLLYPHCPRIVRRPSKLQQWSFV